MNWERAAGLLTLLRFKSGRCGAAAGFPTNVFRFESSRISTASHAGGEQGAANPSGCKPASFNLGIAGATGFRNTRRMGGLSLLSIIRAAVPTHISGLRKSGRRQEAASTGEGG